jgi:hypothetical protein
MNPISGATSVFVCATIQQARLRSVSVAISAVRVLPDPEDESKIREGLLTPRAGA